MACENCDYTDIMIPMDYSLSAFQYANRRQYHQWKMIGIQATHTFLHNGVNGIGIKIDDSGRLVGVASGCKPIEEVNQNNHIIGRGAWYLRAKSDGGTTKDGGTNSAGYGIMGHCQSPGIEGPQGDASFNVKQTAWSIEGYGLSTAELIQRGDTLGVLAQNGAFFRGWGSKQGTEFCMSAGAADWHMAVFFEYTKSYDGKKDQYMQYYADTDCAKECEFASDKPKCTCICRARNSQLPGRFTAWICVDDLTERVYRTCEALNYRLGGVEGRYDMLHSSSLCMDATNSIYSSNDILGTSSKDIAKDLAYAPVRVVGIGDGVMVKLTSLPACNHFEKTFEQEGSYVKINKLRDGEEIETNVPYKFKYRCERAVIRLASQCFAAVSAGTVRAVKMMNFKAIEKHYDRWDRNERDSCKVFDEVFELDAGIKVRVLAHHKNEIMKYYGDGVFRADYTKDKWMTKKYLTGGKYEDGPTGSKGCECTNSSEGTDTPYPIRPYNSFNYCPNNFTCEKTCTGTATPPPSNPGDPGYTPGG